MYVYYIFILGVIEYTTAGKSKVLMSNKTQPYIMLVDGETGEIKGPVYKHDAQRATRMCIDKSTMELYFIDVSETPINIQVCHCRRKPEKKWLNDSTTI